MGESRRWGVSPLCDPLSNPKDTSIHTHCPRVTDGRMLAKANSELPLLFSSPALLRTAGRQTFLLLSFQSKTKECVGPLPHTRACVQTTPSQKLSMQLWADHISAAWACQPAEV